MHDETLFQSSLRPNTGLASLQFKPGLHNKGLPILENNMTVSYFTPSPDSLVGSKAYCLNFSITKSILLSIFLPNLSSGLAGRGIIDMKKINGILV